MSKYSRMFAVVSMLVGAPLFAATYVVPPDRILFEKADAVVIGHVTASRAAKNPNGVIATTYDVRVEEIIKGAAGMSIRVTEPGGRVGNEARLVPGAPGFQDGERVLLFLRGGDGNYTTTDLGLGAFHFAQDAAGVNLAIRDESEIFGWDLNGAPHKEIRRSADGFVKYLREIARAVPVAQAENYAVPARPLKSEALASKMQTDASGKLQSDLTFPNATANSYMLDIESNSGSGMGSRWRTFPTAVNWNVGNSLSGAPGNGNTAIDAAFNAWNNDTCSNVNYVRATAVANTNGIQDGADGVNNFVWEKTLNNGGMPAVDLDPYSCASGGLIGLGGISVAWTGVCGMGQNPNTCRHTFNSENFSTTVETDVSMNRGIQACPAFYNSGNMISGVTHEVGHTLGFRHSDQDRVSPSGGACNTATMECSSSAIMTASLTNGLNGALQAWDQHAVQKVYAATCTGVGPAVKGDFNGDGKPDILLRNYVTGATAVWVMNGTTFTGTVINLPGLVDTNWRIEGTNDFNADGQEDILYRNYSTGASAIWLMNGANVASVANLPSPFNPDFHFEGTGDFNNDGKPDILLRNYVTGFTAVWLLNGTTYIGTLNLPSLANTDYHIEAVADFNHDGQSDLLWRNYVTGYSAIWLMNGASVTSVLNLPSPFNPDFHFDGAADFNADGSPDVVLRNYVTGADAFWLLNSGVYIGNANMPTFTNLQYEINGPR